MIPELSTRRLVLRDALLVDRQAYRRNFDDYAVIGELASVVPWPYPADGIAQFLERVRPVQGHDRWVWAIYRRAAPEEPIGNVDLWRGDTRENRGFWLAKKHWGQGYMTEATDAVTDHAFDVLGFDRLILSNALGNTRSRRIKEKAGAVLLRTEPAKFVNPDYTEREVWELTKENWRARKASF